MKKRKINVLQITNQWDYSNVNSSGGKQLFSIEFKNK